MKTILVLLFLFIICYGQSKVIYTKDTLGNYVYNKKAIDELIEQNSILRWKYNEVLKLARRYRMQVDSLKRKK